MPAIPNFVLKRLYVKGSLVNATDGCELQLRNFVGSGTLTGLLSVDVDGRSFSTDVLSVMLADGGIRSGDSVTAATPLVLTSGVAVTMRLRGTHLAPGSHALKIRINTGEMGQLVISLSDGVREKPSQPDPFPSATAEERTARDEVVSRPLKVAIIGAGSAVFARQLIADILTTPGLMSGTFFLVDVDAQRLALAKRVGDAMVKAAGQGMAGGGDAGPSQGAPRLRLRHQLHRGGGSSERPARLRHSVEVRR